jgi:hypothetical protein
VVALRERTLDDPQYHLDMCKGSGGAHYGSGGLHGWDLAICCLADHGDVGGAAVSLITSPLGMITGALLGWFVVRLFERRFAS